MNASSPHFETSWEKLKRKCKEEPYVPFGTAATLAILTGGLINFSVAGSSKKSQMYMRARVIAQSATVLAIGAGTLWKLNQVNHPTNPKSDEE